MRAVQRSAVDSNKMFFFDFSWLMTVGETKVSPFYFAFQINFTGTVGSDTSHIFTFDFLQRLHTLTVYRGPSSSKYSHAWTHFFAWCGKKEEIICLLQNLHCNEYSGGGAGLHMGTGMTLFSVHQCLHSFWFAKLFPLTTSYLPLGIMSFYFWLKGRPFF